MSLANIPLNKIRDNPVALRSVNKEADNYKGLVESIAQVGVLNAISVRPVAGTDEFELIDGLHRTTAARDAGKTEIPAQIMEASEADVLRNQLIANVHKIETRPVEYTRQLLRILGQNPTMSEAELGRMLGKSQAWINERLNLVKLNPEIQKFVDSQQIVLSNAYALSKLPAEEQVNFIQQAQQMSPAEFTPTVAKRVQEIKEAARQGRAPKPAEFTPIPHLRPGKELQEALNNPARIASLLNSENIANPVDAAVMTLKWVWSVDPTGVAEQREAYEKRKADLEKKKEEAKKEREAKKAEEATKNAVSAILPKGTEVPEAGVTALPSQTAVV